MKVRPRFSSQTRTMLAAAAGALVLATGSGVRAAPCADLMNPVYVAGSTAVKPFVALVAKEPGTQASPIALVYQGQGSCTGVQYLASSPAGTIAGTGSVWSGGSEASCDLSTTGDTVDIGLSDVY